MSHPDTDKKREVAMQIASRMNVVEKQALARWIETLIDIRNSGLPALQKAKRALASSVGSGVVIAAVKVVGREIKRHGWDNRGVPARLGMGATAVAVTVLGGKSAGIAALGGVVGVPLWVVFGAGAAFMGVLYEEITRRPPPGADATYRVIDAQKVDE